MNAAKVLRYVGSMGIGYGIEEYGKHKQRQVQEQQAHFEPKTEQGQKFKRQMDEAQQRTGIDRQITGMNPKNWEFPHGVDKATKYAQYAYMTTEEQKKADLAETAEQSLKKAGKEIIYKPIETAKKTRQAMVNYQVYRKDGDELYETAKNTVEHEKGVIAESVGYNMILKAPGVLLPGPAGILYRGYFNAKIVGNVGASMNKIDEMQDKVPGEFEKVVDRRLAEVRK